jgi:hypothetical protein
LRLIHFWKSFPDRYGKFFSTIGDISKPKERDFRAGSELLDRYHRATRVIMEEAERRQMDSSSLAISADACIEAIARYPEICQLDDALLSAIFTTTWPECLASAKDRTGRPDQEPAKRQAITTAKGLLERLEIVLRLDLAAEPKGTEEAKATARPRIDCDEANIRARDILKQAPNLTAKELAKKVPCSVGLIPKLSAWQAVMEQRRKGRKPKSPRAVSFTHETEAVVGEGDPTLEDLMDEQARDGTADGSIAPLTKCAKSPFTQRREV